MTKRAERMADRLIEALRTASNQYGGEPVTELEHSLQCADLALDAGADEELVLACLLHDVGRYAVDQRLVYDTKEVRLDPPPGGRGHHQLGAELIAPYVSRRVAWLVSMHADAKRYLCAAEAGYYDHLTPASRHTLTLQGGPMGAEEMAHLERHEWLGDALQLRRWDDAAKAPGKRTRPVEFWEPRLRRFFGDEE
jgi:predicted HD phosphohydrolase